MYIFVTCIYLQHVVVVVVVVVVVYLKDSLEAIGAYQEGFVLQKKNIYIYI